MGLDYFISLINQLVDQYPILGQYKWVLKIALTVLAAGIVDLVVRFLIRRLQRRLEQTKNIWDDSVLLALRSPLSLAIWLVGITIAMQFSSGFGAEQLVKYALPLRYTGIIFCLAWFLVRLIHQLQDHYVAEALNNPDRGLDHSSIDALAKLLRLTVMITAGVVILQTLGFSVAGVLAFGGIGGMAIGFAAKDLLANFFGGLMIYMDRPFSVGDWVRSPDRNIEGTVEYIGWRLTRIRTFSKRPLYIPNSIFAQIIVENPSRMSHRRIYETIGLRYDDIAEVQAIVDDVKEMLEHHPDIDTGQTMIVNFNSFAPSSLDFFVYTFTHTTNWVKYHEIKQDVLLKIADIILRHNAEIAFPTSTMHVKGEGLPPVNFVDHSGSSSENI